MIPHVYSGHPTTWHCTGTLEISLLCYSLKDKFLDTWSYPWWLCQTYPAKNLRRFVEIIPMTSYHASQSMVRTRTHPTAALSFPLRPGFLRSVLLTLKVEEKGVMVCGPPCSSFVWVNSYTHGRSRERPLGHASTRSYVRLANVTLEWEMSHVSIYMEWIWNHLPLCRYVPCSTDDRLAKDNKSHGTFVVTCHMSPCLRGGRAATFLCHALVPIHRFFQERTFRNPPMARSFLVRGSFESESIASFVVKKWLVLGPLISKSCSFDTILFKIKMPCGTDLTWYKSSWSILYQDSNFYAAQRAK